MGRLHIYTGDGKGKTTCSIGLSVRAAGAGLRVFFLQFDKGGEKADYSERNIIWDIPNITLVTTGLNRRESNGKFRFGITPEDRIEAEKGLNFARDAIMSDNYDLVILDEAITSIKNRTSKVG